MALTHSDTSGLLVIPGAPAEWQVAPSASGTSVTGVMVLVGEADNGPSYLDEDVAATGAYGVNSKAAVLAKFGRGRLVDAYVNACAPSRDSSVKGSPTRIYLIKTNQGTKAELSLASTYGKIKAKYAGADGNLINYKVTDPGDGTRVVRIARKFDNISKSFSIGNATVLTVGAQATPVCNFTINGTKLTTATPVAASATATLVNVQAGDKVTINSVDFTARAADPAANEWLQTGDDTADATALKNAINASISVGVAGVVTATSDLGVVTITADVAGSEGNAITFTKSGAAITVTGGGFLTGGVWPVETVAQLDLTLADFRTLGDLAAYIDSKLGWSATVVAAYTQLSPSALDQGTYDAHHVSGNEVILLKKNAYDFVRGITATGVVEIDTAPTTGLPPVEDNYLTLGARGETTDAKVIAALAQTERIKANFIIPLFSKNAASDTDTAAGSTYTIAGINAAVVLHAAKCSQFKNKKPRQVFCSLSGTFAVQKAAAQSLGDYRTTMSFLEVLVPNANGTMTWFQPWMESVVAAAMQSAADYKPIFNKAVNIFGTRSCSTPSDFVVESADNVEEAILAGLLVVAPRQSDGVISFISDQTTYGVDANFVLNSIQAVYCADTIAMTVSEKMEIAFVGQNFADVSAGVAMSFLKSIFTELKRLKRIAGSDDAPGGYKNASIEISPPAMMVSAEVKPATGIYFIPIHFMLTQSTQTANS